MFLSLTLCVLTPRRLAGHETTAHTLSFVLYEIAQHPEVEQKLLSELDNFGNNRPIRYGDLNGGVLSYVSQIVQETLRLHPVAPSIMRGWHPGQELGKGVATDKVCDISLRNSINIVIVHSWDYIDYATL